jgi:hypothetical protein
MQSPSSEANPNGTPLPLQASYTVGRFVEPVTVLSILRDGAVMIARADGSLSIVEHHRVRLTPRERLP